MATIQKMLKAIYKNILKCNIKNATMCEKNSASYFGRQNNHF